MANVEGWWDKQRRCPLRCPYDVDYTGCLGRDRENLFFKLQFLVVPTPHNRESKANGELKLNRNYGAAGAMQGCTLRGFDVLGVGVWVGWACRFGVSDLRNLQGLPDSSLELYTAIPKQGSQVAAGSQGLNFKNRQRL